MLRSQQAGSWADDDADAPPSREPRGQAGRFDRGGDRGGDRFDRGGDRFDRGGDRFDRGDRAYDGGGGRADRSAGGRWERNADLPSRGGGGRDSDGYGRRGDRDRDAQRGLPAPVERGFVVSMRENFGFVGCMDREGDLFFHVTEAPVDVQVGDEVEFRVKFNQRSQKDLAAQLVILPKGTIVMEDVSEEFLEGVVTKGVPRGGYGSSFNDSRREEGHGLIEVSRPSNVESEAPASAEDKKADAPTDAADSPASEAPIARKEFVRFNSESVASAGAEDKEDNSQEGDVRKKGGRNQAKAPHFGDEVRFRVATHRKTGVKRAVDLTVTLSAREKMDKEIEQKLETMVREFGMVDRIKAGGGFIKCCNRQEDVYFPFHEVRESASDATGDAENAPAGTDAKPQRSTGPRSSKCALREGDEVSFYVYEDQDDESGRSRPRLTALRVHKVAAGTVSFEELIRSDVEGKVTKVPKEPRNGPEILGIITLPDAAPVEGAASQAEESTEAVATEEGSKEQKKKKGTLKRKKKVTLAFRLSDTEDMSYIPASGDRVVFDEVLDKRSGKHKAAHIRVLELNPKHRETGVIATMKDDFGFIKCAERASDAYFRFTDVMSVRNDFRGGTEVSFDVSVDSSKPDSARATRIVILPHGSVQWEIVAAEEVHGEVVAVPSKRGNNNNNSRGGHVKLLPKGHNGRIRFTLPDGKMLIDLLPELKEQVDAAFIAADPSDVKEDEEVRFEFPTSLSKFERAMIHEYCEWLGITHESAGDKQNRRLAVVAKSKLLAADLTAKETPAPASEVEFKMEDVSDVRYDPHVGDEVKFQLALSKRTKQLICKSVVCVKSVSPSQKKTGDAKESAKAEASKGEGFITVIKSEGFGFIRPANKGQGVEENIFFHVNGIVTGQRVDELKEGMEVQYTISYDDKKKKSRAVGIAVVPAGTVKEVEVQRIRGIVMRASFLNRLKGGARFNKASNTKPASTVGKIRAASSGGSNVDDKDDADADDDDDEEADADAEAAEDADAQGEGESKAESATETEKAKATEGKPERKAAAKKKAEKSSYFYHIQDVNDPTFVLREGDQVEFLPVATAKGMRATKIEVLTSHAVEGVVISVSEDLGGVIRGDGDEALEARFNSRNVLRGDILKEGDRVEYAYRPAAPLPKKKKKAAAATEEASDDADDASDISPVLGQAMSVLRISSSSSEDQQSFRREARSVNSTLLQAMRQVGVNAMVKSRMAKGPDGTRGFGPNWRSDLANATTKASDDAAEAAGESDKAAESDAPEQSGAEASA